MTRKRWTGEAVAETKRADCVVSPIGSVILNGASAAVRESYREWRQQLRVGQRYRMTITPLPSRRGRKGR